MNAEFLVAVALIHRITTYSAGNRKIHRRAIRDRNPGSELMALEPLPSFERNTARDNLAPKPSATMKIVRSTSVFELT